MQTIIDDLCWVIRSPVLVAPVGLEGWWDDAFCERAWRRCESAVEGLRSGNIESLCQLAGPAPRTRRLGEYFEWLVSLWLALDPDFEVVARNLPLRHAGRTLGELDFVLRERACEGLLHLEVAVKFYLGVSDDEGFSLWFGPSQQDRLDLKFNHMQWRQMQSYRRPEVQTLLREQGLEVTRSAGLIKGRLYTGTATSGRARVAGGNCLQGRWLAADETLDSPPIDYLSKPDWMRGRAARVVAAPPGDRPMHGYSAELQAPVFVVPGDWQRQAQLQLQAQRQALLQGYADAAYDIELGSQRWTLSLQDGDPSVPDLVVITAFNPGEQRPGLAENQRRNTLLQAQLDSGGWRYCPARGYSPDGVHAEASFAVLGASAAELAPLAASFGQKALFVWQRGSGALYWL